MALPPCPSRHNGQPRTRNQSNQNYARCPNAVKAQARFSVWLRFSISTEVSECGAYPWIVFAGWTSLIATPHAELLNTENLHESVGLARRVGG